MNKRDSKTIKDQAGINIELKQFVDDVAQGKEIHQGTLELVARGIEKYLANPDKDPFKFSYRGYKKPMYFAQIQAVTQYYDITFKNLEYEYGFSCSSDLSKYNKRMKERMNDSDEIAFKQQVEFLKSVELSTLKRDDPDKCNIENYLKIINQSK